MFYVWRNVQISLLVAVCPMLVFTSGCFLPRVQVGPAVLNPVKNVRKDIQAPQTPNDSQTSFGFDVMAALHVPLVNGRELLSKVKTKRDRSKQFGFNLNFEPGLWVSAELGYSLDSSAFPGKFLVGFGLSYRLGDMLAIGYTPYLLLAGSEYGLHFGMRHSLTIYLFYSIFMIEPQVEFSFSDSADIVGSSFTTGFRVMVGVNLLAPFILLSRKHF